MLERVRGLASLLVIILCFVLIVTLPSHRAGAAPSTRYPTDDSFVRVGDPDAKFDEHSDEISVTTAIGTVSDIGYLRFDVSAATGDTVGTATLRLYEQTGFGSGVTVGVYGVGSDDWNGAAASNGDETTLTYNNAPAEGSLLASSNVPGSPAWMEFSSAALVSYVQSQLPANGGDGLVTLRIKITNPAELSQITSFEDRENGGGTGNVPELLLAGPNAVTLVSFTAQGYDGGVELEWVTASEIDSAGFYVCRRQGEEGQYTCINQALIPSRGGVIGATYHYTDEAVTNSTIYYYQLEEVDTYGHSTLYGPVTAIPGTGFRMIYLPLIIEGQ